MNAIKYAGGMFALLSLGVVLLIGTNAEAAMTNWTETIYDKASGGELAFDWDINSKYDLAFDAPTVQENRILSDGDNIVGTIYQFVIPNFYDPLPRKKVEVTISGTNSEAGGLALAKVLDVFGSDSPYGEPKPSVYVPGHFVSGTTSPTLVKELWHILPNPDWDYVKIWSPAEFGLDNIKIATQSVPLPPSVLLLGSALIGLIFLRRKPQIKH
jgi:hypothetical protein